MRKFIFAIISVSIMVSVLFIRTKIYEWFYNDIIRIIPEFIWKPIDTIFAVGFYTILAVAIYQIIDEYKQSKEAEQSENKH